MMLQEKKIFLRWFITHSSFTRREIYWLINYIEGHDSILESLHFVENAKATPRGLIFTSGATFNAPQIAMYLNGGRITDIDQIFHDLRMHWRENLYVECVFPKSWSNEFYVTVLEDNPFDSWNTHIDREMTEEISNFINHEESEARRSFLYDKINEAIDAKDEEKFKKYSEELRKLEEAK